MRIRALMPLLTGLQDPITGLPFPVRTLDNPEQIGRSGQGLSPPFAAGIACENPAKCAKMKDPQREQTG